MLIIHLEVGIFICCAIFSCLWPFSARDFHKHPRVALSSHSSYLTGWKTPEENLIVFHVPGPTLTTDEVASCLRQRVLGFGELVLALLPFQLPKQPVLLALQPSRFSLLVSQEALKAKLMAIMHLPVFARRQLSTTLFERTDGQRSVSAGHTEYHTCSGRTDFHQCKRRSRHPQSDVRKTDSTFLHGRGGCFPSPCTYAALLHVCNKEFSVLKCKRFTRPPGQKNTWPSCGCHERGKSGPQNVHLVLQTQRSLCWPSQLLHTCPAAA